MKAKILFVLCLLFGLMFINAGLNKFFNYMPMPKDMPENSMEKMMSGYQFDKKFIEQRKIFLWGAVDDKTAKDITNRLLFLEGHGQECTRSLMRYGAIGLR